MFILLTTLMTFLPHKCVSEQPDLGMLTVAKWWHDSTSVRLYSRSDGAAEVQAVWVSVTVVPVTHSAARLPEGK